MLRKILRQKNRIARKYKVNALMRSDENLVMCRKCYSFKYDNSWHFERPEYLSDRDPDEVVSINFGQCPACIEEALTLYDFEYI